MAIPFHLITGFLGSGKTTFLKHYLDTFSGKRRIAVIQNEFSSSGVDGQIIRNQTGFYKILEINNGSVFCVCLLGSFIDSLSAFISENQPDEIIMEASGISDPVSIGQIFHSEKLRDKVFLDKSWCIVDARNFNKVISIRSRLEHQIRIADTVIINKADIASDEASIIEPVIKNINPFALIIRSSFAKIDFIPSEFGMKFFPAEFNSESCRPDFKSVVIKSSCLITEEGLNDFIDKIKDEFIRFKGFINTGKEQKVVVHGVFTEYVVMKTEWFAGISEMTGIGTFRETINFTRLFESYCI